MNPGDLGCRIPDTQPAGVPAGRQEALRRVAATILFAPLFYVLVRYFPPEVFFALVTLAGLLAVGEFYRLVWSGSPWPLGVGVGCAATALLLWNAQWPALVPQPLILLVTVLTTVALPLLSRLDVRQAVTRSATLLMGAAYVGLTLSALLLTRALPEGPYLVFFVVLVTWAGDTGAYAIGKSLGRRPLAPRISPKKTVEGLIGGMILALIVAMISRVWFLPSFTVMDATLLAVLLTLVGLVGDLAESAVKRSVDQKDSGALIPGHGGMLDRLDSLLFTAPCFYYYVTFVKGS